MTDKRKKSVLIAVVVMLFIAWNFLMIPLFLYGSFGSDALLELTPIGKVINLLLTAWIVLLVPNFPLIGILVSLIREQMKKTYYHLGAFIGIVIGSIFFFQGNSIIALILTEVSGLFSLGLLISQLFSKRNQKLPSANKKNQ
ncbi:hypothetical protein LHA31_05475 [Carnobacterium viridans]|uniref:Uncharacterized protein n=1 Tax=Carnobacterium viridans TaxID=174587 RepID=A0A1H1AK90_9LACT|nr:hypothetical protein [Carnobacterium viridans]UDE96159.1 hypothetical protein LHA31_05475 [Carnobacterium viridans]SDQ40074.1 hypothetical protein SAMN04487752_2136 [Carnobacterium viridans]